KLHFGNDADSLPRFWQRRFYDFNVWSLKKRVEKLHYMHTNPMKRGLVVHPKDWPWSNFSFYSKSKPDLIRVDPVNGAENKARRTQPRRPLENREGSGTRKFNPKGCATRPDG